MSAPIDIDSKQLMRSRRLSSAPESPINLPRSCNSNVSSYSYLSPAMRQEKYHASEIFSPVFGGPSVSLVLSSSQGFVWDAAAFPGHSHSVLGSINSALYSPHSRIGHDPDNIYLTPEDIDIFPY
ncbi:hypothetical protein CANCADRAFT_30911 [Tortispora caseinolytica NRRL Y-17796]|uniref:Uncharacterized protein n=1 Tax=Tortispora caseinolytica NRRL Y-17796 TaxID=767744 RepID=A0A1E4TMA8_9ASCO|nr:hypothetical protein CANCADRAFT_30911 [Tortispora caseinolytica NRRL Y-17796]